ncbi:MAG: rod shape-determining protein MreD [Alphaproteobacteria bacterium]|nr:rod shape-determining protein MreD [Alphaproteobacteria bacterium]
MKPSLVNRMDIWARHLVPFGLTLCLLLVNVTPTRIPGFAGVAPMLPMMAVFYWAIFRPDLLPAWVAFVIGLLFDVVSGTPLGVNALVLLLVQGVTSAQRRFFLGNTFVVAWWGFGMIAAGASTLAWMLVSLLIDGRIAFRAVLFEYLLTVSLYPVVAWVLARTQVMLLRQA